jgi:hypothetical protein
VAVGVERHRGPGVPESLSDNLGVDAGDEEEARLGVAQVVEAYPRQAEPGDESGTSGEAACA